ncbi:MAG: RnfABCDGE type electron transport complex subunit D [Clostridia bacterium]|nr:RnfABCDGE type electron transport complex subunit D [Clostridia bacterium]
MNSLSVSPHIHSGRSTTKIMEDVIIALLPTTIAGTIIFGLRSLLVVLVCVASSVLFEALFNLVAKKEQTVWDLSAAVTGLLLALNLSASIPLWQCVVGSFFAIVIVKCIFGGIGKNLVNPAITARVFMLIAFSTLAKYDFPKGTPEAIASATPLTAEELPSLMDLLLGKHGGTIGETSTLALLIGGIYLIARGVISWHIPVTFIGTVYIFANIFEATPAVALGHTMAGGLFIGAIFMATDYTTSPETPFGKIIFGIGCGLLTGLIRYFGSYPDGVSFAILFMNILTSYICNWTRRKVFTEGGKK